MLPLPLSEFIPVCFVLVDTRSSRNCLCLKALLTSIDQWIPHGFLMLFVLFGMFLCFWASERFGPLRRGDARRSIALSVVAAAGRRGGTRRTRPSEGSRSVQVLFEWQNGGVVYSDCETRPGVVFSEGEVWNSSGQQPTVDRAWWKSDPVPLWQSGKPSYADLRAENVFADSSRSNLCAWFAVADVAVENCLQFCLSWWIEEFLVLFEAVYPYPIDHPLDSFSMVDFDAPDLQRLSSGSKSYVKSLASTCHAV